jgi:ubiquinone/menaquinone biosynthesis C-methylase UbiE
VEKNCRQKREKKIWQKSAKYYDKQVKVYDNAYKLTIQNTLKFINQEYSVLDFACGTGIVSIEIAKEAKKVVAVDISDKMIDVAKNKLYQKKLDNLEFKVVDGYNLDYPNNSFNVVLLYNVLHVVQEPQTVLREIKRLLKPDGILLTATDCYAEPTTFGVRLRLSIQKFIHMLGVIPILSYYKKSEIDNLLLKEGFEIIERDILHKNPVNYYIAVKKNKIEL